jgi:hypothetical protein
MNGAEQFDQTRVEAVTAELLALARRDGIHGDVQARLGPNLRELMYISPLDPNEKVTDKLRWQLTELEGRLPDDDLRAASRYEYNLVDMVGTGVVARRRAHDEAGGPDAKTSYNWMKDSIAPDYARQLLTNPPGPMPDPEPRPFFTPIRIMALVVVILAIVIIVRRYQPSLPVTG